MNKVLLIVAAAIAVAAVGIGVGLGSISKPQQPAELPIAANPNPPMHANNSQSNSTDEYGWINSVDNIPGYVGLRSLGYNDQAARYLSSVKLEMISSNNTYYHYVQTTPNGTKAETVLSLTPNELFNTTGHKLITVTSGFDIFSKQARVEKLDQGYHVFVSYFVPADRTPDDLKKLLGPTQPVSADLPFGIKYASAAGTLIYGTGVALESTVITPVDTTGTIITTAPVENLGTTLKQQATSDYVREVQQMFMDKARAEQEAAQAAQRASQTADKLTQAEVQKAIQDQLLQQKIDLRRVADNAAREEAAHTLSRTAGNVATGLATAWSVYNTLDDFWRYNDAIKKATDCYNNPTNPLARDAQKNDPHYDQLGQNLDSAQEGLYVTTGARVGVQGFDAAAGASSGFLGSLAIGSFSQGADAALWNSESSEISDALKGITPCTPCPEAPQNSPPQTVPESVGDHTPGPDEPGFYYTIGPRASYEPSQSVQATQVCKPPLASVQLTYKYDEETEGFSRVGTYTGTANLTPVEGGLEGKGTGSYQGLDVSQGPPCGASETSYSGSADLVVHAQDSIDNNVTGGPDTSMYNSSTTVLELIFRGDNIAAHAVNVPQQGEGDTSKCGTQDWTTSEGADCHFYGIDFAVGGTFQKTDEDSPYAKCSVTITPER